MELVPPTPSESVQHTPGGDVPDERVKMKRQLGLLEGCAIILGIIFGSGIFVSPKGVIMEVNSVGGSLVIWSLCGVLSMIGALCYAELGKWIKFLLITIFGIADAILQFSCSHSSFYLYRITCHSSTLMIMFILFLGCCIPVSGGDYSYIKKAFGDLPSFLYIWDATIIFVPATNAIMSLTFASYVLQPFYAAECEVPKLALQLLAAITICSLTYLNSLDVRTTTKMQNIIMFTKIGALVIIILVGAGWVLSGHTENFKDAFANTETDPGKLSVAFYSGIFSYAGWVSLNRNMYATLTNLPKC